MVLGIRNSVAAVSFSRKCRSKKASVNNLASNTGGRVLSITFLIAFTQSSTFGPTDAPLLARWAKLLTVVQIFISLSIVILLIARAVGVL